MFQLLKPFKGPKSTCPVNNQKLFSYHENNILFHRHCKFCEILTNITKLNQGMLRILRQIIKTVTLLYIGLLLLCKLFSRNVENTNRLTHTLAPNYPFFIFFAFALTSFLHIWRLVCRRFCTFTSFQLSLY
jgi:hypothetical protein